ncbi:hypothetical protein K466DRAFT_656739 [Polyporus arcularius HHB13444]|uniref:BTB domain-containing protein n=1 Tax=Polyporus arcularius HHB13444 TaxID=1314778 RepID=A0A5C3NT59_9APHY|nr:hypothetical protein K466DRAFT_656739 [Polyporus arcularius HHB13444]
MADNNSTPVHRNTPEPRAASSPFNKPSADIILRTSDHVDFHVYSQILIAASPFFEGMFEVPQPPADQQELKEGRPIIELSEDSNTIETLLRICYPVNKPAQRTVQEMEVALRVAMKLEMELAITVLTDGLKGVALTSPMQVWAAACRLHLEGLARTAANALVARSAWSVHPLLPFDELGDMEGISAGDYYRLSEFHRRKAQVSADYKFFTPQDTTTRQSQPPETTQADVDPSQAFQCNIPNPDIVCRSSDGVQFSAHHAVLAAASSSLSKRVGSVGVPAEGDDPSPAPVILFNEEASVLAALLRICYHHVGNSTPAVELPQLVRSLIAMDRHDLADRNIYFLLLHRWRELVKVAPLRAYCVAIQAGGSSYAKEAARQVLHTCLEHEYAAEMESIPALAYHRLWTYYRSCERLATERLQKTLNDLSLPSVPSVPLTPQPAPAPTFSFGSRQPNPRVTPFPSTTAMLTSPFGTPSQSAVAAQEAPQAEKTWIRRYIRQMLEDTPTRGPRVPFPPLQELLVKATGQGGSSEHIWCKECQPLAEDLIKADTHYKDLVAAMDAIELQV